MESLKRKMKKKETTYRERNQVCGYQRQGVGVGGDWMKVVKMYKVPVVR